MFIRRIAVRHWRGLEEAALEDLAPGLNLVSGPNESGKSRLVQALWYGLFESSKGKAQQKEDLRSWGVGSEKPHVEIDFELAGEAWTVEKQFLGTGTSTELRGASKRYEGDDAEEVLRGLLGVSQPSRTGLGRKDAGIWPLLWVDQHESAETPTRETGDDARHRLQDRLTAEVGEVAAGEHGQTLLAQAKAERDRYYTPGRGDETGELRQAREALEECEERLEDARAAWQAAANDAERLQTARTEERDFAERIQSAEEHLRDARARQEAARAAKETLAEAERAQAAARDRLEQARQKAADRAARAEAVRARAARVTELTEQQENARRRETEAAEAAEAVDAAVTDAEGRAETARATLAALRETERRIAACDALITLRRRHGEARTIAARITELTEQLADTPELTAEDVEALSALRDQRATARAQLEGASVRLTLDADRDVAVDGETVEAGAPRTWTVDDDRRFEIEGLGHLRIEPGGGELATLRDRVRDAEAAWTERLRALGVNDLAAARAAQERRRDLERERAGLRTALEREAQDGVDALAAAVREQERRLDLAPDAEPPPIEPVEAGAAEAAETEERTAREALEEARSRREDARTRHQEARNDGHTLDELLKAAREELTQDQARLDAMPSEAEIDAGIDEAERALRACETRTAEAREAFEAAGGEGAADDVERHEKSVEQLRESRTRLGNEISVLQDRLRNAGDDGRHERVQELEAECAQARSALERIEGRARAARRLYEVLETASREARERLAGPVVERIRPYLAELFPGAEVWLDENMSLQGLRSERADARFDELSGGAREQLALLVRIGLSEVLGAEESWPLVLDDALVNTDADRIERLQRLLFQASRQMQILLFTCHGRLFDAVGADRVVELTPPPRTGGTPS
jgi:DNA repair exonuclease SbcCD ATPase subunit